MARGKIHPALAETLRLLRKQRRPPTEADRPFRPPPGPKPKVLHGQIDLWGRVHGDGE
jgi:hypothetical protein